MSSAGQQLVAGRIPGERIGKTTVTSDSATFNTTETVILTLVFPTVAGRTYEIWAWVTISSTVDNDDVRLILRQDSVSGAIMQESNFELTHDLQSTRGEPETLVVDYVADATENKTIVVTGTRASGSGEIRLEASSNKPSAIWANYVSG
jgi:hypothetical protein